MMPSGCYAETGGKRALRGGSWNDNGNWLRSANRNANSPDNANANIGLRLCRARADWMIRGTRQTSGLLQSVLLLRSPGGDKKQGTHRVSRRVAAAPDAESPMRCRPCRSSARGCFLC